MSSFFPFIPNAMLPIENLSYKEIISARVLHVLAETGFAEAQYQLGLHYCIVHNPFEAMHWLQLAAKKTINRQLIYPRKS